MTGKFILISNKRLENVSIIKKFSFLYFRSKVVENKETQNVFILVSDKKMGSQN